MALTKNFDTSFGINAEYWKITAIHIGFNYNKCQIDVSLYLSEIARSNNNNPILTETYMVKDADYLKYFNIEELNKLNNNVVVACYNYLKENISKFETAVDS